MTAHDDMLKIVLQELTDPGIVALANSKRMLFNRDVNGRGCFIVDKQAVEAVRSVVNAFVKKVADALRAHGCRRMLLEVDANDISLLKQGAVCTDILLTDGKSVLTVVDRLATESDWNYARVPHVSDTRTPRIVLYSIKGGVGRSTALAVYARQLAGGEGGKRVLVLDLDLQSPGISSSLLNLDSRPSYGVTDWLVEDLVDNGQAVLDDMAVPVQLSGPGQIYVVPAHGQDPGEYVIKLGKAWMPKVVNGVRCSWAERLSNLLGQLESKYSPDFVLIDSRAGIDDVSSACMTALAPNGILFFGMEGSQTRVAYDILFRHLRRTLSLSQLQDFREKMKIVAAMVPETETKECLARINDQFYDLFAEHFYDEDVGDESAFNFDPKDEDAPHSPFVIRWSRGFQALENLHVRLTGMDDTLVRAIFDQRLLQWIVDMPSRQRECSDD